ncbi:matrix metalloproteinase-21-like [Biomphalaria glabrata]|uniref:Matrix metalloproteinase-21-like n=1 Tax=Biomphalaria glabrata TaxID=6526 RepID=A0A9W2ZUF9_BIOGL|nr:matrix metalloproteinase-21-like [Biomphalaria glabrata]XP_055878676.1 matrix metalloproteinase-21-like [Biomphalaria glabrata]XP_055878680.1 matrix metalloproteinase-21-like [Biomphalaria glabrata]XP_055878685.1 matrix metalloproteinase-21-like [Biomphalaria glabrata]XP_055878692.1 matrix metalloproteinase-21-like [Biomphalaria glabrata]
MLWWRQVLVGLVHTLPFLLVAGEPFYQRRDHLDQAQYMTITNENVVKDRTDAEFVLSKYGYLRCQVTRRKREATHDYDKDRMTHYNSFLSGLLEEGGGNTCDEIEVQKAIRNYQRTYNLPETGELDDETKSLMSTSRCGNKDSLKGQDKAKSVTDSQATQELDQLVRADTKSTKTATDDDDNRTAIKSQRLVKRSLPAAKSKLYRLLAGETPKARTLESHKKYLEEYIQNLRAKGKGQKRLLHKYTRAERKKRSVHVWSKNSLPLGKYQGENGELFNKDVVRWRLLTTGFSTRIPVEDQRATIDLAFRMWSEVIPLRFTEDTSSDIHNVDIEIAFGKGSHQNCEHDFDGNGGEIAHSWNAGNMHFDDEENFKSIRSYSHDGIYLLRVAVHEIGHVLGLSHTNKSHSIMYAIYHAEELTPEFELARDDRHEIQNIYGVCKGKFDTAFDWVRKRDNQLIYNTYFFRDNHYWMYENHANRTRYGDPLYIAREWNGVPNNLDGYAHVLLYNGQDFIPDAFFFKGEYYYKYNSDKDSVVEGWPRLIKDDFGPKAGETESIPDNIDSVFFDLRDRNLYFFKNDEVYVYNPTATDNEKGCCVRKRKIIEEFPPAEGHNPLPSNLDVVYYSYKDKMMYFFKGEDLWRNKLFDPRQRRTVNSIEYVGPWYHKWKDVCDVNIMNKH